MITWNNILEYKEGWLYWKDCKSNRNLNGALAGCVMNNGYIRLEVAERSYSAHRIIYEMHFGQITDNSEVDHIDGEPSNNLLENLRLATHSKYV
jgi:hypothetical protein